MEEPTKIIREGSRIAVAAFAEFVQQETGIELSATKRSLLSEHLDYHFHLVFPKEMERIVERYLEGYGDELIDKHLEADDDH